MQQQQRRAGARARVREHAVSVGGAVAIALLLRAFVAEAYVIPSESMLPTLQVGDHIFASKFTFGASVPLSEVKLVDGRAVKRGEVIVFDKPGDGTRLIKRAVAIGGDRVALRGGRLRINGRPVPRVALGRSCASLVPGARPGWLPHPCAAYLEQLDGQRYVVLQRPAAGEDFGPITVPAGHVFALGDNRDNSNDSRFWGFVPYSHLKARALVVWWSSAPRSGVRWRRLFSWVHDQLPATETRR